MDLQIDLVGVPSKRQSNISIFYSYAPEDKILCERLDKHLSILKYIGYITTWHRHEIDPGKEWATEIDKKIDAAHIILLLVSADFLASGYCFGVEVEQAMQKHREGTSHVIPVLLRPVDYDGAPFDKLPFLPANGRPITNWRQRDNAFVDVAKGIREVVIELYSAAHLPLPGPMYYAGKGGGGVMDKYDEVFFEFWELESVSDYYNCAYSYAHSYSSITRMDSKLGQTNPFQTEADALKMLGDKHAKKYPDASLRYYQKALEAYDKSFAFDNSMSALYGKARIFYILRNFTQARTTYEHAIGIDPLNAYAYYSYSLSLHEAKDDYRQALAALHQALHLNPFILERYQDWEYAVREPSGK